MKSIGQMLETIDGLRGTKDVTAWEDEFIGSCMSKYGARKLSCQLSAKQVEIIERIFNKHFESGSSVPQRCEYRHHAVPSVAGRHRGARVARGRSESQGDPVECAADEVKLALLALLLSSCAIQGSNGKVRLGDVQKHDVRCAVLAGSRLFLKCELRGM